MSSLRLSDSFLPLPVFSLRHFNFPFPVCGAARLSFSTYFLSSIPNPSPPCSEKTKGLPLAKYHFLFPTCAGCAVLSLPWVIRTASWESNQGETWFPSPCPVRSPLGSEQGSEPGSRSHFPLCLLASLSTHRAMLLTSWETAPRGSHGCPLPGLLRVE